MKSNATYRIPSILDCLDCLFTSHFSVLSKKWWSFMMNSSTQRTQSLSSTTTRIYLMCPKTFTRTRIYQNSCQTSWNSIRKLPSYVSYPRWLYIMSERVIIKKWESEKKEKKVTLIQSLNFQNLSRGEKLPIEVQLLQIDVQFSGAPIIWVQNL